MTDNSDLQNAKDEKKPFYQRGWFIVLFILIIIWVVGKVLEIEFDDKKPNAPTTKETTSP